MQIYRIIAQIRRFCAIDLYIDGKAPAASHVVMHISVCWMGSGRGERGYMAVLWRKRDNVNDCQILSYFPVGFPCLVISYLDGFSSSTELHLHPVLNQGFIQCFVSPSFSTVLRSHSVLHHTLIQYWMKVQQNKIENIGSLRRFSTLDTSLVPYLAKTGGKKSRVFSWMSTVLQQMT